MNKLTVADAGQLESWVPKVIATLKMDWADYVLSLPANKPAPNFSDWLALLHAAATTPDKLPQFLAQLLEIPGNSGAHPADWLMLTDLLGMTFDAAKSQAAKLTAQDWQNMVEVEQRVVKAAAQISSDTRAHPAPESLTRQAQYIQIIEKIQQSVALLDDNSEPFDPILLLIQQTLGYPYLSLFLLDPLKQQFTLTHAIWDGQRPDIIHLGRAILENSAANRAAATGQPVDVTNIAAQNYAPAHPQLKETRSLLVMPLFVQEQENEKLVGLLEVGNKKVNAFLPEDKKIVRALANYLSLIIHLRELHRLKKRYIREQALIYDTVLTLGGSAGANIDISQILAKMSKKITTVMEAGACVICKIDEQTQTITALAEYVLQYPGNPKKTWRPLNVPVPITKDPIARQTLKVARPAISRAKNKNTTTNLIWRAPSNKKSGTESRWNVLLAVPFETQEKITGLIEIYDKNPRRTFSPEDIQFCRILATQTAMALEQANAFNSTVQRLNEVSMLYTLAQKIAGSLDLEEVLNIIVTSVKEVTGCRACCIFLLDETGEQLEIKAADGLKPQWRKMAKLQLGEGAAGAAAASNRTVYVADTSHDPNYIFFDREVRSLMVVPLVAHGQVIGAINVDDIRPNAFGKDQERLLTIAAAQAGISIENARLFTKISAEQKQMQAVIQHMADGLLLINRTGKIITCNSTLAMMLEMDRGQITGKNINAPNLHPNLAKVAASSAQHRARTGVLAQEITTEGKRPRTLRIFITTLTDDNGQPVGEVRVVHDVTKERELDQLKDDFFSTISHELRTPLFSIKGFAQIMLEEPAVDRETQKEFLTTIQRQADQLSEMVNNLLDISKLEEGKLTLDKKPVSLIDTINQTLLKLQGYAYQQQVTLKPDLNTPLPTIIGDSSRLEQVLTNLIGNAIKFSPEKETVTVQAMLNTPHPEVLVQVQDNGVGIPAEALENIFSRYYQVNNNSERSPMGTGLGLHIAKQIVEGHNGRIWAESKNRQGSTFKFTLPLPT